MKLINLVIMKIANIMKRSLLVVAGLAWSLASSHAAIFLIDISPIGGALNLGSTTYTQDHAVGMRGANEAAPTTTAASGNEVSGGITYDDASNILTFDFAYGSDFGFGDLEGDFTAVHLHAPGAVNLAGNNVGAGVIHDLGADHTAGSSAVTGRITGTVTLSAAEETDLFDNEIYVNIHSQKDTAGEIRGQLVAVPEPSSAGLLLLYCRAS